MDIRAMLLQRLQGSEVARILVKQAQARIRSRGGDIGGYAPLWADTARIVVGKGKRRREVSHYRKGGTPLYDTGKTFQSLTATTEATGNGVRMTLQGSMVAAMHQHGFSTSGPNFIPFTRKAGKQWVVEDEAKRKAGTKRKSKPFNATYPISSPLGLVAGKGVTIPARPIFAMPQTARREVAQSIARALGAR
jgi:phage gpG-like protein